MNTLPETIEETARWLVECGYWPVVIYPPGYPRKGQSPATGKEPLGKAWGTEVPSWAGLRDKINHFRQKGNTPNLGLCLGPGRGPGNRWLIDLEGDGEQAEDSRGVILGGEVLATVEWTSVRGRHQLFLVDDARMIKALDRLKAAEARGQPGVYHFAALPGFELRVGGTKPDGKQKQIQSVCPPSIGTDGTPRSWTGSDEVAEAPEVFYAVLESLAAGSAATPSTGDSAPRVPSTAGGGDRVEKYLRKALESAYGKVSMAAEGNRHATLLSQTRTLAGYLHYGLGFTEADLAAAMTEAGDKAAPGRKEDNARAVRDAIADGKAAPLGLPDELHALATGASVGRPRRGHPRGTRSVTTNGSPCPAEANQAEAIERPEIVVTTEAHEAIALAADALAGDLGVFQRGGTLVRVIRDAIRDGKFSRPPDTPRIASLPSPSLLEALTRVAVFVEERTTRKGDPITVPVLPPPWLVSGVLTRAYWPKIRRLDGIVEAPTLRRDGSILSEPGFDEQTSILYLPGGDFPSVPTDPCLEDARRAAATLLAVATDFPFAEAGNTDGSGDGGAAHRAVWLAALLSVLVRFAIDGPCPMFIFDATTPGAGKTLLAELIAVIAFGRTLARTPYPGEDGELRKVINSVALAGDRLVLLDNVASTFGGSALDAAVTATSWRDRRLGASEMATTPLIAIWLVTANNLALRGDILRRIIYSRLEPRQERPEERDPSMFAIREPLDGYALKRRAELVVAGLTIVRAYHVAGRPDQRLPPVDFRAWSDLVRSAVKWATGADPCASRQMLVASDADTVWRAALVEGWAELPGSDRGMTVAEALACLQDEPTRYRTLRDALMERSRTSELPSRASIGRRLMEVKGRVINGKTITSVTLRSHMQAWKVVDAASCGGSGGLDGGISIPRIAQEHTTNVACDPHTLRVGTIPIIPTNPTNCEPARERFTL